MFRMRPEHPQTPPSQFAAGKHALLPYQTAVLMGPTNAPNSVYFQLGSDCHPTEESSSLPTGAPS